MSGNYIKDGSDSDSEFSQEWSREMFQELIKNSFDIFVLLDKDGCQKYVSESCENILGFSPKELTGISVIDRYIHPDDREKAREGLKNILENETNGGVQYRHRYKNGSWVYLEAFGTNQINNPEIGAVILNIRDISGRKKAEQALKKNETRLKEKNTTKDRFFSVIGHDLKTPFNTIVGFSDILVEQVSNNDFDEIDKYARIINEAACQAMELLDNLLQWARAQSGRIKLHPEKLNLIPLVDEVLELFKKSAQEKNITFRKSIPSDMSICADKSILNAVLRNLISNSVKYTKAGGHIKIHAEKQNNHVLISVAADGVGIDKNSSEKLFQLDRNYSTAGTCNEPGTGLGLLLCKEFVDMHGGDIWVESEVNEGSVFYFTLPEKC